MSYCIIDSKKFSSNIKVVSNYVSIDKIAFVLKNNAYGHGLLEMAQLAKDNNIRHAVVINCNEAKKIKKYFSSILVLSGIPKKCPSENIHITINDINDICKIPSKTNVELKVDTGMHRNGISVKQFDVAINKINDANLNLKGIFTHFSNAFEDDGSVENQKDIFDDIKNRVKSNMPQVRFHCSSSPGIFRFDNNAYDIVRVGIAMYGYVDLPDNIPSPKLSPVLSLWSEKVSERFILKGGAIGYGRRFRAKRDMTISTYDIGYGNGFFRLDENKQFKISDGRDILGRVSMNNLTIEGSDNEICVFNNVRDLAELHGTISYEILCRLDSDIPKRII